MDRQPPAYHLVRSPGRADEAPTLDTAQQAVVDHAGGPLLVLAGPGTGKTATIVETVADRIVNRGIDPERVLVLTFSRKAAEELRERITARLRRTTREPLALTFHSYAYALVRREFVLAGDEPPTLLSGPEQLLEVRRMLRGEAEDGGVHWPQRLLPALATRGFAAELRDFLLRAAERGLDGRGLTRLGRQRGRDDWEAAGGFLDRYAARFDLAPVPAYDYSEIIRIAAAMLGRGAVRDRERKAYDVVLVDEYQDTDPAQEELLHALAGDGRELIAVGDPDQSVYAFRGADPRGIARFPERFRTPDDRPARVVALRTCRRSGTVLLAASRRVASRLPAGPVRHRDLDALPSAPPGTVRVITATSASQEAAVVADVLRRARLHDGVSWSSMAVLVRSVVHQVPLLRRALTAAGVPTVVAGDELPLTAEPGVQPLVLLLRCALRPGTLDEDAAEQLLTGPLGGSDALGLRRLRRALRAAAQAAAEEMTEEPLAAALRDPRELTLVDGPAAEAARRLAALLALARDTAAAAAMRTTPCGRCGTPPAWPGSGRRRARQAGRAPLPPTATSTPWSRSWSPPPASPRGCRPARPCSSWTACPARRSRATRWRGRRRRATPSASSPPIGPRAWSGMSSWWPGCRRASGRTCGCGRPCSAWTSWWTWRTGCPGPPPGPTPPPRRSPPSCSARSAGCSTSRRHAPAGSWPSPPPADRTARNARPASLPSWPVTRSRSST